MLNLSRMMYPQLCLYADQAYIVSPRFHISLFYVVDLGGIMFLNELILLVDPFPDTDTFGSSRTDSSFIICSNLCDTETEMCYVSC